MSTYQSTNNDGDGRERNRPLLVGGFTLLLAAFLLLVLWKPLFNPAPSPGSAGVASTPAGGTELPKNGPPLQVGATVYDFELPTVRGEPERIHLAEEIGRPLIINFWASWCGPCRLEAPNLQAAHVQFGDDGLVLIGVNQDEPAADAQGFIDEFGWTFPSVLDDGADVARRYGVFGTLPATLFVNADGEVTNIHRGPLAEEQLDELIAEIMTP